MVLDLLAYVFAVWLLMSVGTSAAVILYVDRRGDPTGWRFNEHGASLILGHLSFYQREGGHALVLRTFKPFPLFWTVKRTPEPGAYLNPEVAKRGPVWAVVPWAYRWMSNKTVLDIMERMDEP